MTNKTIGQLIPGAAVQSSDIYEVESGGLTFKHTADQLKTFMSSTISMQASFDGGNEINVTSIETPLQIMGASVSANALLNIVDFPGRIALNVRPSDTTLKSNYDLELLASTIIPVPLWGNPGMNSIFKWGQVKGSFRSGTVNTPLWDEVNVGPNTFCMGVNCNASGSGSFVFGSGATSSGAGSMVLKDSSTPPKIFTDSNNLEMCFANGIKADVQSSTMEIGDVTSGDGTLLSSTGMVFIGNGRYKKDINIPPELVSGSNPASDSDVFGNKRILTFQNASTKTVFFTYLGDQQLDQSENVEVVLHWYSQNTDTNICNWFLDVSSATTGDNYDSSIITYNLNSPGGTSDILLKTAPVSIPGSTFAEDSIVSMKLYRPSGDPMSGNANLVKATFTAFYNTLGATI